MLRDSNMTMEKWCLERGLSVPGHEAGRRVKLWMEKFQLSNLENTCSDSRPKAPVLISCLYRSSCRSLTCFICHRKGLFEIPLPPRNTAHNRGEVILNEETQVHPAQTRMLGQHNAWSSVALSKKLSLWYIGYWYHHPICISIWSWPFLSFHGSNSGYSCLVTNCRSCLDENYKSPTLNFNWGQIKGKKLGLVFFPMVWRFI